MIRTIGDELRHHVPFTLGGAIVGIAVAVAFVYANVPHGTSSVIFWTFHPLHVFFSAIVTAAMYRLHSKGGLVATFVIGYAGAVGIGTLSDSLIPYLGEWLLGIHDAHVHGQAHIGFIEMWWLVNPLAILGIVIAIRWPRTKLPHAGHVLLSTGASLFHMIMALGKDVSVATFFAIPVLLFAAVWIPCCTSDIVFPLLFAPDERHKAHGKD